MSTEVANVSAPEDFGAARAVITLPVPGPAGVELRVEIEAAPLDELVPLLKGLPGTGRDTKEDPTKGKDPLEVTEVFFRDYSDKAQKIVERWLRKPTISFNGPKPGTVEWKHVHLMNRVAIVNAIARFSQTGEAAERLATFPDEQQGGAGDGSGSPGGVPAADAAAPAVPEATRAS